jgi:hypothetical protein
MMKRYGYLKGRFILVFFAICAFLLSVEMAHPFRDGASLERNRPTSAILPDPQEVERQIISLGQNDNRVMDHLDHLTNRIGPRLAGSRKHRIAAEWARDRFEAFGLSNAHLEKCGEVPVGFNRGESFGSIQAPVSRELHFTTPAWSAGTDGKVNARAVIAPKEADDLAGMGRMLDGAWVLRHAILDPVDYESYMEKWGELDVDIAGMIIPSRGELLQTFGNHRIEWDDLPEVPQVILLESEWQEIAGMISGGEEVILEFDIRHEFVEGPIPLHNVVADIPGTEYPDEYVIVGGHLDSWDGATGTHDNGTGVTATMEAARLLMESGARPRRTIRFILFAGEEIGMVGSRDYVDRHPELLPKISAILVMDQGGDYIRGIMATEAMADDFEEVFEPVMALNEEMPFEIKVVENLPRAAECGVSPLLSDMPDLEGMAEEVIVRSSCGGGPVDAVQMSGCATQKIEAETGTPGEKRIVVTGNPGEVETMLKEMGIDPSSGEKRVMVGVGSSDYAPFLNAGVPGFMWDQKGDVPYFKYAHSQYDTYDTVVPGYLEHSSMVIALAAHGIANLDHMLSRENLLAPLDAAPVVLEEPEATDPIGSGGM